MCMFPYRKRSDFNVVRSTTALARNNCSGTFSTSKRIPENYQSVCHKLLNVFGISTENRINTSAGPSVRIQSKSRMTTTRETSYVIVTDLLTVISVSFALINI
jgi:hypothetical protein